MGKRQRQRQSQKKKKSRALVLFLGDQSRRRIQSRHSLWVSERVERREEGGEGKRNTSLFPFRFSLLFSPRTLLTLLLSFFLSHITTPPKPAKRTPTHRHPLDFSPSQEASKSFRRPKTIPRIPHRSLKHTNHVWPAEPAAKAAVPNQLSPSATATTTTCSTTATTTATSWNVYSNTPYGHACALPQPPPQQ